MDYNSLIEHLRYFIEIHHRFIGSEDEVYTPKIDYKIKFWFEGGLQIEGEHQLIEINLNSLEEGLLILALNDDLGNRRILRVLISKIVAFELIQKEDCYVEDSLLLHVPNNRKN